MGGSKSAKGGPNPLADMDREVQIRQRGVQIRCDTGSVIVAKTPYYHAKEEAELTKRESCIFVRPWQEPQNC